MQRSAKNDFILRKTYTYAYKAKLGKTVRITLRATINETTPFLSFKVNVVLKDPEEKDRVLVIAVPNIPFQPFENYDVAFEILEEGNAYMIQQIVS